MLYLLWMLSLLVLTGFAEQPDTYNKNKKPKTIAVTDSRFSTQHRTMPWCVTGNDEPEFQRFPLSEFKPFLDNTITRTKISDNHQVNYHIELKKVKVDREDLTGNNGGTLYNTAHFVLRSEKRSEFKHGVVPKTEDYDMEGLIVQVNFAPYGVGLPTGTWLTREDIPCGDCFHHHGRPIGCKKRTWANFMHPTILVFHHKMNKTKQEREDEKRRDENLHLKKYCMKESEREKTKQQIKDGNFKECSNDDACKAPATGSGSGAGGTGAGGGKPPAPKPPDADTAKCVIPISKKLCSDKSDKPKIDKPCGEEPKPEEFCKGTSPDTSEPLTEDLCKGDKLETISGEDYEYKPKSDYLEKTAEIHSNLVWFTHPCHNTRVIKFMILAVHSFSKGIYYAHHDEKRYNLPGVELDDKYCPPFVPSPVFSGLPHSCETNGVVEYTAVLEDKGTKEFSYSKSYGECVVSNPKMDKQICENDAPKGKKSFIPPPKCDWDPKAGFRDTMNSYVYTSKCPLCPQPVSTTAPPTTRPTAVPLIKRGFHGGINFVTNFAIMPVTVFIARFYKETFNTKGFKGVKLWYWLHLFGSGGSSVLMYFGYFSKTYVEDDENHVIYGNIYIMVLAFAYITSWARHKNSKITAVAEVIHGTCGYICFGLAIVCMLTVPGESVDTNGTLTIYTLIFTSCGILGVFYIAMTCHICILDKRFGMNPSRRHFPTVEVRFDSLPVPESNGRIIVLVVLAILVFGLCSITIFF